jgi:hypothetical protein
VTQASAADCLAEPLKRVGDDVARALVGARKETGATDVIVPWDGAPSATGARFGRIVDELARDGGANLLVAHLPHPLGTSTRIFVFFPPGAASARGLTAAVTTIEHVAKALGAPLLAVAHEPDLTELTRALDRSAEPPEREVVSYPNARGWLPIVAERIEESDLIIALALREDEEASAPDAAGIAQRICSRSPEHDVIVLFGADPATGEEM